MKKNSRIKKGIDNSHYMCYSAITMENQTVTIQAYYRVCPYCKQKIITLKAKDNLEAFYAHIFEQCKVYHCLTIIKDELPKTVAEFKQMYSAELEGIEE